MVGGGVSIDYNRTLRRSSSVVRGSRPQTALHPPDCQPGQQGHLQPPAYLVEQGGGVVLVQWWCMVLWCGAMMVWCGVVWPYCPPPGQDTGSD